LCLSFSFLPRSLSQIIGIFSVNLVVELYTRILVINQFLVVTAHYNPARYIIVVFSQKEIYQNSHHITDDYRVLFEVIFFVINELRNRGKVSDILCPQIR
jgi:hypothetical protein